jgi:cobyrinic acid a,c-diamide synthase
MLSSGSADLALVEGRFQPAGGLPTPGGKLEPLCDWLDLPRVAIVDARLLGACRLPKRPEPLDGLLLDHVRGGGDLARLATDLESLWGVPVLGALESLPRLRRELAAVGQGDRPDREVCRQLGEHFSRYWKPEQIAELAFRREMPRCCPVRSSLARWEARLTVAIAYDEAFNCYFSETLDLLEAWGASVVDFSPLRDEHLPPQADVVYLGCGHPERFAAALAENHCMKAALRSHLFAGRRIYGEGGGAAYLCQHLETPDGQLKRMVGVLPAIARLIRSPGPALPRDVTLARPNWLGDAGTRVRGYRNPHWQIEPTGTLTSFIAGEQWRHDLVGTFHAVGSLIHLYFAAQPAFLDHFFRPEVPSSDVLNSGAPL